MFAFTNDFSILLSTLDHFVAELIDIGEYVRYLSNSIGVLKGKGVASELNCAMPDNGNIVSTISNSIVADKGNL